jgi:hypothetical protein
MKPWKEVKLDLHLAVVATSISVGGLVGMMLAIFVCGVILMEIRSFYTPAG